MQSTFVVARHAFGGIGDHISCLIGSWWLAKRTGRVLVVDWRGSRFNGDRSGSHNCFQDYYRATDCLAGVKVIADDRVAALDYPTPIFPPKWTREILASTAHMKHTTEEIVAINHLVTSGRDRDEPTIVINQWVHPHPPKSSVSALLDELQPTSEIKADADRFWDAQLGTSPAIGIHLRHGNGENIGTRAAYWLGPVTLARQLFLNNANDVHKPGLSGRFLDNMPESFVGLGRQRSSERSLYRRVGEEFRTLARAVGSRDAIPLLFTDAPHVLGALREFIPTVVACPKMLMERGAGPLHQIDATSVQHSSHGGIVTRGINERIAHEMFVELELLRRCSGLICMESGFSIFAQRRLPDTLIRFIRPSYANRLVLKVMSRLK